MSVPRKMQELAAIYGCEIIEKSSMEGDELYAKANDNGCERFICRTYNARFTNLAKLNQVLQDVSGRTLAQFWTGR